MASNFSSEQLKELEEIIEIQLNSCKVDVDRRVDNMHSDMTQLRKEFHEFRTEFSEFAESLSEPLQQIAGHMKTLAGLPEAWSNFKGFLGVLNWIKDNLFALLVLLVIIGSGIWGLFKGII